MTSKLTQTVAAALLTLGLFALAPAQAEAAGKPFAGAFKAVGADSYAMTPKGGEFYAEEYELRAWNAAGDRIDVSFVVNNLGFGDHHGRVKATWRPAGGTKIKSEKQLDEDDWSHKKAPFALKFGKSALSGGPKGLDVAAVTKRVQATLSFKNVLPPWRPGDGRMTFGKKGDFYDLTLLAPKAAVTGTIVVDGMSIAFSGIGFADHAVSTPRPDKSGQHRTRYRSFDGDWTIVAQQVAFPADVGGKPSRFLFVGYKDRVVFQSLTFDFGLDGLVKDAKSGYSYPTKLVIDAKEGDRYVRLNVAGTLRHRADLLGNMGSIKRSLVEQFIKPVGFYFNARYDIQVGLGGDQQWSHQGAGDYFYKQANK